MNARLRHRSFPRLLWFRGKNGIKGEVVMRNGKILGWAWGAGFVDGIGQEWSAPPSRLSGWVPQPLTGLVMS